MLEVNFKDAKVGDIALDLVMGWVKIIRLDNSSAYPIRIESCSYTLDGRLNISYNYPTLIPLKQVPEALYEMYGEPPWQFIKGDKVLVRDHNESKIRRRYFSHTEGDRYCCFNGGCDEWSSWDAIVSWDVCVPWVEE